MNDEYDIYLVVSECYGRPKVYVAISGQRGYCELDSAREKGFWETLRHPGPDEVAVEYRRERCEAFHARAERLQRVLTANATAVTAVREW